MGTVESAQTLNQGLENEADEAGNTGSWRVVIQSIGDAGATLIPALSHISSLPPQRLAALLYQAPSVLVDGISQGIAEQMSELLASTGVVASALHQDEGLTPGQPDYELALVIKDVAKIPKAIALVSELVGIPPQEARKLICSSPAVLMGQLSQASVEAISRRFQAIGVEVDVSQPEQSRFDLFIGECDASSFAHALRAIRDAGIEVSSDQREGPLMIPALDWEQSRKVWPALQRLAAPTRMLNQQFERYDLRLDEAPETPAFIQHLMESTGMPEAVARKIPARTPITLHQSVPFHEMGPIMEAAAELGASMSAHLLAFQKHALEITRMDRLDDTATLIQSMSELKADSILPKLSRLPARFEGPFTNTQARWLQTELKRIGTVAKVTTA